jgi:hypothetical protein
MTQGMKAGRKVGAVIGGIAFLIFGLMPGFYFGSYGTLVLLSHLTGGPVAPTIIARMLVVVGIVLGVFCVGAVSIVLGALFGTAVGYVSDLISAPAKEPAEVPVKNK